MPFTYEVDAGRRLIIVRLRGFVLDSDIEQLIADLEGDPRADSSYSRVIDLLDVTGTSVSAGSVRKAVAIPAPSPIRRALVAKRSDPLVYGLLRMAGQHREAQGDEVEYFDDLDEAIAWAASVSPPRDQ